MDHSEAPVIIEARHHDEWLIPASPELRDIAQRLHIELEASTPRAERFRQDAADRRRAMVENLVSNFMLLAATKPPGARLIISARRDAKSRYDRPDFPKKAFMSIVEALERLGYLSRSIGTAHRERTTLEPSESLLGLFQGQLSAGSVSHMVGAESIWLTCGHKANRKRVDYTDTPRTLQMREEMSAINGALRDAEITLHGKLHGPVHLVRMFRTDHPCSERFDLHGRIFGGFWHNLPKEQRHGIRLNGQPIVEMDFSSMFPRLAYIEAGVEPPDGDLYAGVDMPREAAKIAMSALLWRNGGPMRRLPEKLKELLEPGWNGNRVTAALAHKHPAISGMFGTGCGLRLAYLESQVLVSALLKLIGQGIVALPHHDGLLCERGHEAACRSAMEEASEEVLGKRLPVGKKITAP